MLATDDQDKPAPETDKKPEKKKAEAEARGAEHRPQVTETGLRGRA